MIINKQTLMNFFSARRNKPLSLSHVMSELEIPPHRREQVRTLLREMAADGTLITLRNKHYALAKPEETVTGVLELHQRGFGFVRPITSAAGPHDIPDIFIPPPFIGEALNNDKVEVKIIKERESRSEGRIVRILERGHHFIVGRFIAHPKRPKLVPRDRKFLREIELLPDKHTRALKNETWVMAQIIEWPAKPEPLKAMITEILGSDDEPRIGVTLLIKDLGIEMEFPEDVMAEAAAIPAGIPADEISRRTDFRRSMTFTIDPIDAKDFDDALHVRRLQNGNYELGIHIADVTHYVRPGTALDTEGLRRATSIYPVDRVVPMLPERLSNDLCSLRPNEERLVMSAVAEIDPQGGVVNYSFHEGVIKSAMRFHYEQVEAILGGADKLERQRCPGPLLEALEMLRQLTAALIARRDKTGRLDMDIPEEKAYFNSEGEVSDLVRKPRLFSNRMVEEAMLLANELVAEHLTKRGVPLLYRVHEEPDIEKLEKISGVFRHMGVVFDPERALDQKYLQRVLDKFEGVEAGHLLHTFLLRAMMRARYSPENLGHFGLASKFYCHFTSPIRRYPDVVVHRQLRAWLLGEIGQPGEAAAAKDDAKRKTRHGKALEKINHESAAPDMTHLANHCSQLEQRASNVEYEAYRIKAMEFMAGRVGEEFEGWVGGITGWGMYIELKPWPVEGLIPLSEMDDDYYEFDQDAYILQGRRKGRVFRLAQPVRVWLHSLDRANQTLSLRLCDDQPKEKSDDAKSQDGKKKKKKGKSQDSQPSRRDQSKQGQRDRKNMKNKMGKNRGGGKKRR